jgi:predicted RND superfamily exporter protein
MQKKKKEFLTIAGTASALLGILGYIYLSMNSSIIIINTHYSTWRQYKTAAILLIAIGAVLLIIRGSQMILENQRIARAESESALRKKELEKSREMMKKLRSPEDIRACFETIRRKDPDLSDAFSRLEEQLSRIAELKVRMRTLLEMNDLEVFANTEELLDQIEDYISANCRKAVNYYIISGDKREDLLKSIFVLAADNEEKLSEVQKFLDQLLDYANSQEEDDAAVDTLKIYRDTIKNSIAGGKVNL